MKYNIYYDLETPQYNVDADNIEEAKKMGWELLKKEYPSIVIEMVVNEDIIEEVK